MPEPDDGGQRAAIAATTVAGIGIFFPCDALTGSFASARFSAAAITTQNPGAISKGAIEIPVRTATGEATNGRTITGASATVLI